MNKYKAKNDRYRPTQTDRYFFNLLLMLSLSASVYYIYQEQKEFIYHIVTQPLDKIMEHIDEKRATASSLNNTPYHLMHYKNSVGSGNSFFSLAYANMSNWLHQQFITPLNQSDDAYQENHSTAILLISLSILWEYFLAHYNQMKDSLKISRGIKEIKIL